MTGRGPSASAEDLAACRAILARGSKSFHAASRALPARLVDPVAAFYAFCRVSDDLVDDSEAPRAALAVLHARLDGIYSGTPAALAEDRALAWVAREFGVPREPIDALLEGYLWDAEGRDYETLSDVCAYAVRVASSVGLVMTALMMGRDGARDASTLARAADLGVAMQLTNIARDVGEDARRGRLYLPRAWLREEDVEPDAWLRAPRFVPGVGRATARLLDHAEVLYARAAPGIERLPADCRAAIRAASAIYADIGRVVRENGYDAVSARAVTSGARKAWLLAGALAGRRRPSDVEGVIDDAPLPEASALIEAVAR